MKTIHISLLLLVISALIWCQTLEMRMKKTEKELVATRALVAEHAARLLTYQRMDIQFSDLQDRVDEVEKLTWNVVDAIFEPAMTNK